jgi:AcrR family transcriptional regulator
MAIAQTETRTRRRRRPEEAEREIFEAGRELFVERPWHEVTVGEIMERTTLSRKSFYVYFRDRYELIARIVAPLRERGDEVMADLGARATILGIARIYHENGELLRALAEAARWDREAERVWRGFTEGPIARIAQWIEEGVASGAMQPTDPEPTARRLVGMNLYAFFDELAGRPDADVERLVDTLNEIWTRVLYGRATA